MTKRLDEIQKRTARVNAMEERMRIAGYLVLDDRGRFYLVSPDGGKKRILLPTHGRAVKHAHNHMIKWDKPS